MPDPVLSAQYDERQASYVLTVMCAVYALLLERMGARPQYPLEQVFPPE